MIGRDAKRLMLFLVLAAALPPPAGGQSHQDFARLEDKVAGIGEGLARLEGRFDSLASKEDLARLEGKFQSQAAGAVSKEDFARLEERVTTVGWTLGLLLAAIPVLLPAVQWGLDRLSPRPRSDDALVQALHAAMSREFRDSRDARNLRNTVPDATA